MRSLLAASAAALVSAACLSAPARSEQPWLEPGDLQARQDVETLKAWGYIRGPVEAYPLPWRQLDEGIDAALNGAAPAHVRAAAVRLSRLGDYASENFNAEVRVGATNRPALIRGFDYTAREQADVAARVSQSIGPLYISSGVGYRTNQVGADYHFEPSYAVLSVGNWAIYGGYVEQYWGPGYDGAIVIGNSARPFPKVGFQRLYPYKPRPKFLRWIGPWRFNAWGGVLPVVRQDSRYPAIIGMQFSFEPVKGLELNVKRITLLCGGRQSIIPGNPTGGGACSAKDIAQSQFPFFGGAQPGDSLAGPSISYTRHIGALAARIYWDGAGEDKDGYLQFDQIGQVTGGSLSGPLRGGASWHAYAEYADTLATFMFTDRPGRTGVVPGSFYNNSFYFSGKYYRGDAIGHPIGGDSYLTTASFSVTDTRNRRWYAAYRDLKLNRYQARRPGDGGPANPISANRERIDIVTAGTVWPTPIGDVRIEGRYMGDQPNTPGRTRPVGEIEASWRTRF
jgi:hypothetical protein